jgi:hypothetical protein
VVNGAPVGKQLGHAVFTVDEYEVDGLVTDGGLRTACRALRS